MAQQWAGPRGSQRTLQTAGDQRRTTLRRARTPRRRHDLLRVEETADPVHGVSDGGFRQNNVRSSQPQLTATELRAWRHTQGWNFGRFLVLLGSRRLYSLSGKSSPSIPFPIEPEVSGTQSTRRRPHRITHQQTHGITTKAYRSGVLVLHKILMFG